jgi:hypothetical protein
MSLRFRLSTAARELRPLQQGDLDALCGLYAIINAIRLALYPRRKLRPREVTRLFDYGLAWLSRTRRLRLITSEGMRAPLWSRLCDAVLAEATAIIGEPVSRRDILLGGSKLSDRDAVRRIKRSLRDGRPVLVALMGSYNHSSVIVSHSAARFTLFDSRRLRWIRIRSISFDPAATGIPHVIPPSTVVAIATRLTTAEAAAEALQASRLNNVSEGLL